MTEIKYSGFYSNDDGTADIWFDVDGAFVNGYDIDLSITCYNMAGYKIKTVQGFIGYNEGYEGEFTEVGRSYPLYLTIQDVPAETATVLIAPQSPAFKSNTYLYADWINVYTDDGRAKGIPTMQLPAWEAVGWHGPKQLYSLDGRVIQVEYCSVPAYKKVGWYEWIDYEYLTYYNDWRYSYDHKDYQNAFIASLNNRDYMRGTYYESYVENQFYSAMDAWRKASNSPIGVSNTYYSNGKATIGFYNISYKTIIAVKLSYGVYDIWGNKIQDCNGFTVTNMYQGTGEYVSPTWNIGRSNGYSVKNIKVEQVVFSDGTSWHR